MTQAEWDTLQNPVVLDARTFPGADAGLKIAAAIAALPVGIGGLVTALFPTPQNATGFVVPPGVTVQLGPVLFTILAAGPSIVVQQGGRLFGMGTCSPGSTTIKASNGFNKDLVQCMSSAGTGDADYWHHGRVRDLRIDGNKAQNTTGHGLSVYACAETSTIRDMNIFNCAQAGLYIKGSQSGTGSIENVTVNSNGVYGVQLDEVRSGLLLKCVGGDHNPITFGITNPRLGGGPLLLIDPKSEGAGLADPGMTPVIRITGGSARVNLTITGGNWLVPRGVNKSGIQIAADVGVDPLINIQGLSTGGTLPILIDDLKNTFQLACEPLAHHGLVEYCARKYIRFDVNGFTTGP